MPTLGPVLSERLGEDMPIRVDGQAVYLTYPQAFSLAAIQPQIFLEIGPVAAWVPNEPIAITPYAAIYFPKVFKIPGTVVRTIAAERTFWEKATILHQEAHRSADKKLPPRYSRHYYDLYRLAQTPIRQGALGDLGLLNEVVQFKSRFYRCAWACYEDAVPGGLKLLPADHHLEALIRDYSAMQAMLFGSIPTFDAILAELTVLEEEINSLQAT